MAAPGPKIGTWGPRPPVDRPLYPDGVQCSTILRVPGFGLIHASEPRFGAYKSMGDDEPIKKDEVKQSNEHEKRAAEKTETQEMPFSTFLEQIPPDTTVKIVDFAATTGQYLSKPDLLLYCENEKCKGPRLFHCDDSLL